MTTKLIKTSAEMVPLIEAANGVLVHDRKGYKTTRIVLNAILIAGVAAKRANTSTESVLQRLAEAGLINVVGRWYADGRITPDQMSLRLPAILGVPVTVGPVRIHPNGRCEISHHGSDWELTDDATLQMLQSERRLGLPLDWRHHAAQIIEEVKASAPI